MGPSGIIFFCLIGLIWGSRSGSKTILEPTNVDYQFLVLEVQPYLFVFNLAKFWAFLHFLGSSGLFLGSG